MLGLRGWSENVLFSRKDKNFLIYHFFTACWPAVVGNFESGYSFAKIRRPDSLKGMYPYLAILGYINICIVRICTELALADLCFHFLLAEEPA